LLCDDCCVVLVVVVVIVVVVVVCLFVVGMCVCVFLVRVAHTPQPPPLPLSYPTSSHLPSPGSCYNGVRHGAGGGAARPGGNSATVHVPPAGCHTEA
jgi:hypothetical protein